MPSYTPIAYATAFFPNPTLPKIIIQPTFEKLQAIKKFLKANATSGHSDLGGGQFGHLGLVLDDTTYYDLTGSHYVRPVHPSILLIPKDTTHHEAVRLREEHNENIRLFHETMDVNNALMKQIINTIDADYIKELQNEIISKITKTIPQVLTFLFTRYGEVNNERVIKVKNFTWTITDPPVVIYNLIDDLDTISEAAGVPKTVNPRIQYGVDIIKKTREFENSLLEWFARPTLEHSWKKFKSHVTNSHTELAKVRGSSM